ncbi:FG-GAP-like repeat-containing protein [Gaopeijia maritima]|uniref:FG-GAP-like repeat-containing protein n=1 Tax=Gaopeijia maritima TaxID=3119007 RepID=UPI003245D081
MTGGHRGVAALAIALTASAAVACASSGQTSTGQTSAESMSAPVAGGFTLDDPLAREIAPFPVMGANGLALEHPFLGGFVVPRPQLVDIDGDGDLDLFIQERTGELMHLENVGDAAAPSFVWRTDRYQDLDIGEWSRFHDLDGDGDLDLLAEERFSYVRMYRNEGSATDPRFVALADSLRDDTGKAIFADRQNIASLADVDCDGVIDLFLGRVDGTVSRYEAVGTAPSGMPIFTLVNPRFEDIEIVAQLAVPGGAPQNPTLHGANSMAFADGDGDGDVDLFWGDYFEPGLLFIENYGTCNNPDFRSEPQPMEADGELIATSGYNAPWPADLDGDGDLDLLVGVLGGAFNANRTSVENLRYYESTDAGWSEVTRRFITQIDIGSESVPAFTDLDGDGDLDLVIGSKLDADEVDAGRLHVFENVGTPSAPRYEERERLLLTDSYHYAPVFADLDGDGADELLLGTWNEDVRHFRRSADGGWEPVSDAPLVELPRGSHSVPAAGDLDGDGDLDLIVGEASGELNFFRNVGTSTAPAFELVTEKLDDIDVGRRSFPVLYDLDGDGDLDLLVGREDGGVAVFRNVGSATEPRFEEDGEIDAALPKYAAPALGDVDGDGDLDLVVGGLSGGLVFHRNLRNR